MQQNRKTTKRVMKENMQENIKTTKTLEYEFAAFELSKLDDSDFKHLKLCPKINEYYTYVPELGCYHKRSENYVESLIYKKGLEIYKQIWKHTHVSNIFKQMLLLKGVEPHEVERNPRYICFSNGLYDLEKDLLIEHTPNIISS